MSGNRAWTALNLAVLGMLLLGAIACAVGVAIDAAGFYRAWLCAYLFWLGLPLCGVTLVLVHDLSGGEWMATARPFLAAAAATMPIATLAGIPACIGLPSLYGWTHPPPSLGNTFYLNGAAFLLRYAVDIVLWNLLAGLALFLPRGAAAPVAPGLSWLSAAGLILLAVSAGFAAIDWIMSAEPAFWSSVFPMVAGANWFNTGLALVLFAIAVANAAAGERRRHMADLAAILLATTIFWAYVEFVQFLIIWEGDLKQEIPWYLLRLRPEWRPALLVAVGLGFLVPFFALLWAPMKRRRGAVALVCGLILLSRLAYDWWLVLPAQAGGGPFWLDVGAVFALGGPMLLLFMLSLRRGVRWPAAMRLRSAGHG
jgi:hypothetical protein